MKHLPLSLEGRVALVTGGGSGIGAAMAVLFARVGATVIVAGRNPKTLGAVVARCIAEGGRAWSCPADVGSPPSVAALFEEITRREGRLDILVNNAAPTDPTTAKGFTEHSEEDWAMFTNVILVGTARCCAAALPLLRSAPAGVILNISSVHASSPRNAAGYAACKAGLENLTRKLAVELAPRGIRVNALAPGWIVTEGVAWSMADEAATARAVEQCIPLNRLGTADEMANVALFLCSNLSSYMTGSIVLADGGWLLR